MCQLAQVRAHAASSWLDGGQSYRLAHVSHSEKAPPRGNPECIRRTSSSATSNGARPRPARPAGRSTASSPPRVPRRRQRQCEIVQQSANILAASGSWLLKPPHGGRAVTSQIRRPPVRPPRRHEAPRHTPEQHGLLDSGDPRLPPPSRHRDLCGGDSPLPMVRKRGMPTLPLLGSELLLQHFRVQRMVKPVVPDGARSRMPSSTASCSASARWSLSLLRRPALRQARAAGPACRSRPPFEIPCDLQETGAATTAVRRISSPPEVPPTDGAHPVAVRRRRVGFR